MKQNKQNTGKFDITEYTITAGTGLTIALAADLHNRPCGEILRILTERRPDLIAIAGDLVDGRINGSYSPLPDSILKTETNAFEFLKQAVKIAPTYYALGNHEIALSNADFEVIRSIGVIMLDNTFRTIRNELHIGGLTSASVTANRRLRREHPELDWWNLRHELTITEREKYSEIAHMPESAWLDGFEKLDGCKVLICHHPEYWAVQEPFLCGRNFLAVLSGHSHGGQIRIGNQGLFAPGQGFLPKYTAGVHQRGSSHLAISRGLANTARIPRIHNRPELVLVGI